MPVAGRVTPLQIFSSDFKGEGNSFKSPLTEVCENGLFSCESKWRIFLYGNSVFINTLRGLFLNINSI